VSDLLAKLEASVKARRAGGGSDGDKPAKKAPAKKAAKKAPAKKAPAKKAAKKAAAKK
jgi:DNA end-binding protein Ku